VDIARLLLERGANIEATDVVSVCVVMFEYCVIVDYLCNVIGLSCDILIELLC
jgi:hypothetical protein